MAAHLRTGGMILAEGLGPMAGSDVTRDASAPGPSAVVKNRTSSSGGSDALRGSTSLAVRGTLSPAVRFLLLKRLLRRTSVECRWNKKYKQQCAASQAKQPTKRIADKVSVLMARSYLLTHAHTIDLHMAAGIVACDAREHGPKQG